jgi:CBS-domain-containing membrane protein
MSDPHTPVTAVAADLELSAEDVYEAMARLPGYIDISVADFQEVYRLALDHALDRLFGARRARDLMHPDLVTVAPGEPLDVAARRMAAAELKSVPVTDPDGRVVGVLSEADYLVRLGSRTFLELLLRFMDEGEALQHRCHETPVSAIMTAPAVTLAADADFWAILAAFRANPVRRLPLVDADGRLLGVLARKDFIHACGLEERG